MSGWIKVHRQIKDSKVWLHKPFSRGQAWLDILLNTSYEASTFWSRGILTHTKPGQCALSVLSMSERWGWSRGKVGRFLLYLENEHQIEHQKNNVTTLITVVNWEKYQDNEHQNGHQTDTRRTPDGHNKEVKEVKEVKRKNIYGEFKNVKLTEYEYEKLKNRFNGLCSDKIEALSSYMASRGKKYKDHYATILNWGRKEKKENKDHYDSDIYK